MTYTPPRVFLSYAWEDVEHRTWVKTFRDALRDPGGVDAWVETRDPNAVPGADLTLYMEEQIRKAKYVLLICTPTYKDRFDTRTGGVGYEANLIASAMQKDLRTRKFIPIVRKVDGDEVPQSALPGLFQGRYFLDFRTETQDVWNQLLDAIHDRKPPPIPVSAPPARPPSPTKGAFQLAPAQNPPDVSDGGFQVSSPPPDRVERGVSALETWKEKLAFLENERAKASDAAQIFTLNKRIEEAEANIKRLEKKHRPGREK